jgi:cell division protein FtsQ
MKKFWKIAYVSMWILLVAGACFLVGFTSFEQYNRPCRRIYVTMDYGQADKLVIKEDIDSIIRRTTGRISGKPMGWINIRQIERSIKQQAYVEKVHIYESLDGNICAEVKQREPILRIINSKYETFYVDGSGRLLPPNPFYPARVLVANGNISHSYMANRNFRIETPMFGDTLGPADTLLLELYKLALYINRDKFLKADIDQIYVTPTQEFELLPKVGGHVIMLGRADNLDEKFKKLLVFYKKGLNIIGWNKYNYINIKYTNQVVCSKLQ